jgi:TolA-binding protein
MAVRLPTGAWDTETKPGSKDFPGKLVKTIGVDGDTVLITTTTNGFGFIKVPTPGKAEFVLQIYRDPIGARWKPKAAEPAVAPAPAAVQQAAPRPAPVAAAQSAATAPAAPAPAAAVPTAALATAVPRGEADLPPDPVGTEDRKPFFAVPYSVRTDVTPPDSNQSAPSPASGPAAEAGGAVSASPQPVAAPAPGQYPGASALRFKAVNKSAEEVMFAELAGPTGQGQAVQGQAADAGSPVVAPVAPPPAGQPAVGDGTGAGQPLPVSQSAMPQPVIAEGVPQVGGAVGGGVVPPPAAGALPVAPSGEGEVVGSVAPPVVVQGAPPPTPTAEDVAALPPAPVPEEPAPAADEQGATDPGAEVAAAEANASDPAAQPGAEAALDPEAAAKAREEEIRNKLYEAQSMMFNGNLDEALPLYEDILKQPDVPVDVREETLYAVADIKKQKFSNDLAGHFDEISQAFLEAMNANLRSNRVPRALLNLGLLNLQVSNFPEAKAYFKILQEKYPDDDNIPSISYYWGEYYYKRGDFMKAADQFQYLIQTYPEHELVKPAAYYLADSLNRTGFLDQAFQIVDYIDKRWPDYYMENTEFLRLAGSVEMSLKKWEQAKNHYFTYYNLNPEAEGADVVLARIGDIYVHQGEKAAAKQIYEKATLNYPSKEGGLVARMRLAEEGIHDDPTMPEMGSVFDRPYNLRPEKIYQEIVEQYPDSPLAPIAQLKLAMWYAFNKQYPEALGAAQDLIEKYPDSPLVAKARTLGDSVFALAVPGMVDEERFGRIIRYWETYDFIGKEDTKVDDGVTLQVALSYWKVGQPDKALSLIRPYLQKRQVPGVSDKALGLAVNIYLDQLAWKDISDLVSMAKANWTLQPEQLRQLEYAQAMSLQNLGESNKAIAMWAELAKDVKVEPAFRAYAMYYMAKAAMDKQDLRKVFVYAQEALSLLLQTKGDPEKIKDAVLMSIYATERSGRYDEALKWAKEYDRYIDVDNPEWASTRFKLARIYRKAGAMDEWKQLLGDIIEKKPDSLQAKLAKSALDTYALEQQVQEYAPSPQ